MEMLIFAILLTISQLAIVHFLFTREVKKKARLEHRQDLLALQLKVLKKDTELLQEKRLSQAAWLLRNTGRHVDEIAVSVGYENVSYFHRLFAARFGCSPKQYRDCK